MDVRDRLFLLLVILREDGIAACVRTLTDGRLEVWLGDEDAVRGYALFAPGAYAEAWSWLAQKAANAYPASGFARVRLTLRAWGAESRTRM